MDTTGVTAKQNMSGHDRNFIEKNIWYPNHVKTKELIMDQSHHRSEMSEEVLDLLEHINVWLSKYELICLERKGVRCCFCRTQGLPVSGGIG